MVKLQKQISRKKGNKEYYKYVITIPPEVIKEKGLKAGDEIQVTFGKPVKGVKEESRNLRKLKLVKKK